MARLRRILNRLVCEGRVEKLDVPLKSPEHGGGSPWSWLYPPQARPY